MVFTVRNVAKFPLDSPKFIFIDDRDSSFAVEIYGVSEVSERIQDYYQQLKGKKLSAAGQIKISVSGSKPQIMIKDNNPPTGIQVCQ